MRYRNVCIESTGYVLPPTVLSSAEIETRLASVWDKHSLSVGYLEDLTGIRERRVWPVGTKPSGVAAQAGQIALDNAGVAKSDVQLILHTGVCRDASEPSTANVAHSELGLDPNCMCFDVGNACLGFLNGMLVAANMIELGQIETALVVSGENSGPIYEDTIKNLLARPEEDFRSSMASLTLGSGAVAFVLQAKSVSRAQHTLLGGTALADSPSYSLCQGFGDIHHQSMVADTAALMKNGLALTKKTWKSFKEELDWDESTPKFIFNHQVSRSHHSKVFGLLDLDMAKGFCDMEQFGNTGTVAAPMSLSMQEEKKQFEKGDKLALLGMGSGLNCMMLGVEW